MSDTNTASDSHSPAPWKLNWRIAGGGTHPSIPTLRYVCVESANTNDVADPLRMTGYVRPIDAHLIAAAPDLLKALKDLLSRSEAEGWAYSADEREAAEAAIAKAEGKW